MKLTRRTRYLRAAAAALLVVWVAVDLFAPRRSNLREFNPEAVARLETDMWRAYYERHQVRLFFQMAELLRTQYQAPLLRSNVMAFDAARAAFAFKGGTNRSEYERALPPLIRFYSAVRGMTDTPFGVTNVAKLELEWWIIHRERNRNPAGALDRALADLQDALYLMPAQNFAEHARYRAEAMLFRDVKWDSGRITDADWENLHEMLRRSWSSLFVAVNRQ